MSGKIDRETLRGEVSIVPSTDLQPSGISRESSVGAVGSFHSSDSEYKYTEVGGEIVEILIKDKKCKEIFKLLLKTNLLNLAPPPALGYKTMFGLIGLDFDSWYGMGVAFTYKTAFGSNIQEDIGFLIDCIKKVQQKAKKNPDGKHKYLYRLIQNKFFNSKLKDAGIEELNKSKSVNAKFLLSIFPNSLQTTIEINDTLLDETSCCPLTKEKMSKVTAEEEKIAQHKATTYISNFTELCENQDSATDAMHKFHDTYGHIPINTAETKIKQSLRKRIGKSIRKSMTRMTHIFKFAGTRKNRR